MAVAFESDAARAMVGRQGESAAGLVAGPPTSELSLPRRIELFDASHPAPNAASEAAGRRALALAAESRPHGVLVVLLSGGASAMLAVPAPGISLSDKVHTARALMNAGAPIAELNCVRKHLSAIKGGRLAAAAAQTVTLAISDVHGPVPDDPAVIGSGPTVADPTTFADALEIIRGAGLISSLPRAVVAHLERGQDETPKPGDRQLNGSAYHVIGNREIAMDGAAAAARARGYDVRTILPATAGEAREAGAAFAATALRLSNGVPACVIGSGEPTVHVRGTGRGGRNQEFVLGALPAIEAITPRPKSIVLASVGTDGIDGPTDAAGAIVDLTTSVRARAGGLHPDAALALNDSYPFFAALGDLVRWGPTGTNVGDLHVLLIHP
jgi:hydroxypyruvate reductase